jgi:hypothetical protein
MSGPRPKRQDEHDSTKEVGMQAKQGVRRPLALLVTALLALAALFACSGGKGSSNAAPSARPTSSAAQLNLPVSHPTVWLCRPGMAGNPCEGNLDATLIHPDGSKSLEKFVPASDPKVDCFYIYPTLSTAKSINAPLAPEPTAVLVARSQVARFASVCRLFVPVYRQVTLYGLTKVGLSGPPEAIADADVDSAWHDYLNHDNHGRGVILIGHSQGAGQGLRLLRDEIEKSPAERSRLVAAYLIGGNVLVPQGKDVGGDLKQTPACRTRTQHDCVVGFSSFDRQPPSNTFFGKPSDAFGSDIPAGQRGGLQVLCVNPAALRGGTAKLHPYISIPTVTATSPPQPGFTAYPEQISGTCTSAGGATWLQIDHPTTGPVIPPIHDSLGPNWGLHRLDMSVEQGDLISLAAAQSAAWPS